jgi:hypothetical protein
MRTPRSAVTLRGGRPSFTLIELLVVITIIAALIALAAGVILKFAAGRPKVDTGIALKKFHTQFHKRWMEVTDAARKPGAIPRVPVDIEDPILTLANGDPDRARVIWAKIQQRLNFPQTYAEVFTGITISGVTIPALPGYQAELKKYGITATTADPPEVQAGVCLFMVLKLNEQEVGGPNLNTTLATGKAPCIVDSWGNPIIFSRWPLGNWSNSTTPADPSDPQGKLKDPKWLWNAAPNGNPIVGQPSANAMVFHQNVHALFFQGGPYNQLTSGKLTPVLASSGADGKFGLGINSTPPPASASNAPGRNNHWDALTSGDTFDNMYSDNLPQ